MGTTIVAEEQASKPDHKTIKKAIVPILVAIEPQLEAILVCSEQKSLLNTRYITTAIRAQSQPKQSNWALIWRSYPLQVKSGKMATI